MEGEQKNQITEIHELTTIISRLRSVFKIPEIQTDCWLTY